MSSKWKNVLLPSSATILDALDVINREGLRIALVTDKNDYLIGGSRRWRYPQRTIKQPFTL